MDAESSENSGNLLSRTRHDPNRLRKVQRVKYRVGRGLRQPLDAQKTLRSNIADQVSWLIDRRNQQAMWRAVSKADPEIAEIVGLGRKVAKLTANLLHERLFVTRDSRELRKTRHEKGHLRLCRRNK